MLSRLDDVLEQALQFLDAEVARCESFSEPLDLHVGISQLQIHLNKFLGVHVMGPIILQLSQQSIQTVRQPSEVLLVKLIHDLIKVVKVKLPTFSFTRP